MKKRIAYIVDCYGQSGGSYMMYNIGKLLHEEFGFHCVCVLIRHSYLKGKRRWNYEHVFEHVNQEDMEQQIGEQDLLVCHEYYSQYFWGKQLPGFKIMYIQAFSTIAVLDGFFDAYVCASDFLAKFFHQLYCIDVKVIPPFLQLKKDQVLPEWETRSPHKIFVMGKQFFNPMLKIFQNTMQDLYPDINFEITTINQVPHAEVVEKMLSHRYFVWLSLAEGFGLPPLEAMACGCTVVGFHSQGGNHYMRSENNCLVCQYPDMESLCHNLALVLSDNAKAKALAHAGPMTALPYSKEAFVDKWGKYLGSLSLK